MPNKVVIMDSQQPIHVHDVYLGPRLRQVLCLIPLGSQDHENL